MARGSDTTATRTSGAAGSSNSAARTQRGTKTTATAPPARRRGSASPRSPRPASIFAASASSTYSATPTKAALSLPAESWSSSVGGSSPAQKAVISRSADFGSSTLPVASRSPRPTAAAA